MPRTLRNAGGCPEADNPEAHVHTFGLGEKLLPVQFGINGNGVRQFLASCQKRIAVLARLGFGVIDHLRMAASRAAILRSMAAISARAPRPGRGLRQLRDLV